MAIMLLKLFLWCDLIAYGLIIFNVVIGFSSERWWEKYCFNVHYKILTPTLLVLLVATVFVPGCYQLYFAYC